MKLPTILMAGFALFACEFPVQAVIYTDRNSFSGQVGVSYTDDYQSGYGSDLTVYTDAQMSAVKGQTQYQSTGFNDVNVVFDSSASPTPNRTYCAGCNGSFKLGFASTSYGNSSGVFGVGFNYHNDKDIFDLYNGQSGYSFGQYSAFVKYGNGTTENFLLPFSTLPVSDGTTTNIDQFFGITSKLLINSIHISFSNQPATSGLIYIDDLTIASDVPEPTTWAMMLIGFGCIGRALRHRQTMSANLRSLQQSS